MQQPCFANAIKRVEVEYFVVWKLSSHGCFKLESALMRSFIMLHCLFILTYFLDKCFKTPDSIPRIRRRLSETFRAQYINTKEIRSNILPLYPGNIRANSSYTNAEFPTLCYLVLSLLLKKKKNSVWPPVN